MVTKSLLHLACHPNMKIRCIWPKEKRGVTTQHMSPAGSIITMCLWTSYLAPLSLSVLAIKWSWEQSLPHSATMEIKMTVFAPLPQRAEGCQLNTPSNKTFYEWSYGGWLVLRGWSSKNSSINLPHSFFLPLHSPFLEPYYVAQHSLELTIPLSLVSTRTTGVCYHA